MDEFDRLAEVIANHWYNGTLPDYPAVIVSALMGTIPETKLRAELPHVPASVLAEAKRRWADCLLLALRDRIAAQDAARSQWKS